jgi:hypothetical protein
MDQNLVVKLANESRLQCSAPIQDLAKAAFEAGQKNGFYQVLHLIGDGWADLDDVAVNDLSYNRALLLDMIVDKFKGTSLAAFIRNRLEELKERDAKAKAELNEINRRREEIHKIMEKCEDESEVLSELLKEIE